MQIFIRTLNGKTISCEVESNDNVNIIKDLIQTTQGIEKSEQRVMYRGKQLEEWVTFGGYDIDKDATLDLVVALKGGGLGHLTRYLPTLRTPARFRNRPSDWMFPRNRGEGCDFNHWQVWPRPMKGSPSKDDIINYYISVLAQVLGSEEEAIHRIYSVATRQYYAFGVNADARLGDKILGSRNVCFLLPDLYVDPVEKRYPWDPFINGQALPYDSKYYPPSKFWPNVVTDEQLDRVCSSFIFREGDYGLGAYDSSSTKAVFGVGSPLGDDLEHWQIYLQRPFGVVSTKDELIQSYINFLAQVLGSEEEAVKKIYSVATRHWYGFGANVSEEIADKITGIETVNWVLPDTYLDPVEKRYPWDPFINGQALPYDPKNYVVGDWRPSDAPFENSYINGGQGLQFVPK